MLASSGVAGFILLAVFISIGVINSMASSGKGNQLIQLSMLSPESGSSLVVPPAEVTIKTLVFNGEREDRIVGLMAKLPSQNEKTAEVKSVSEVDNKAGRDLLSILNKY